VLAVAMRDDPSLARSLRVIDALGPSTIQPVAVSKRVPARQRLEIQEVLTTMHEDPAMRERLALGMVERFVPVDASSYDDIRMMRDACEAARFKQIR
jgi:phosphonate transport system substrate-binding protein